MTGDEAPQRLDLLPGKTECLTCWLRSCNYRLHDAVRGSRCQVKMRVSLVSAAVSSRTRGQAPSHPLHHFGRRKELNQLLAGEDHFLDWKCRRGAAVCLMCAIMLAMENVWPKSQMVFGATGTWLSHRSLPASTASLLSIKKKKKRRHHRHSVIYSYQEK